MNARIAYSLNSQFGPTSECIDIASFISNAAKLRQKPISDSHDSLAEECSVDDIRSSLSDVWNDTRLSSHLLKDHDSMVNFLYGTSKSARPRKKIVQEAPLTSSTSVEELEQKLSMVKLASWKLTPEASLFIRAPKDSELNIYSEPIKAVGHDQPGEGEAIVIFSVYNKVLWRPSMVSRASQHCILTSQTLGDLFESIPCLSNELPAEELEGSRVAGYGSSTQMKASNGCAICIEGMVYGDGLEEKDYADKLLQHVRSFKSSVELSKATTAIHDTPLKSLSLRINHPYWMLHEGNCEHFIVIDAIRLKHSSDPSIGYPLTLHREPAALTPCACCSKTVAVWSIIGDERLGESPCLLCAWCWKNMGPAGNDSVVVAPLPKYQLGW
ncbi:snrna-activating protein complex subunit 3-like [Moniliophthora roreri MCA 2997]|uniref:Snrna-activating protein complex subunit 3-like n=1 Tax=Moniliophthora roreri (strain MCA 2997) TaxID=1381753 RepID=V2XS53_MONRO|nr:snrna-activating protein complex subunit 3-like [Moniliophthora roreri MCA 2997]